jgi:hypothetical protein
MKGIDEQTKRLIEEAKRIGFMLSGRTTKGHLIFKHERAGTCFFSGTPSDYRAYKNCLSKMRRQVTLTLETCD